MNAARHEPSGRLRATLGALLLAAAFLICARQLSARAQAGASASGVVVDGVGPVGGARVRVRATEHATLADAEGRFLLDGLAEGQRVELTAWAAGYYIASTHITPTVAGLTLTLRPYHTTDNPDYIWPSPIAGTSAGACGNCHPMIVSQWITNAHGSAVDNPRFYSLYNGTAAADEQAVAPGYLLDFPGTAGNCASCHAPGAAADGYLTTNMNDVRGVITAGIHCDLCHKIGGVYLDPATGSVYANVPGIQGLRLLRPPAGDDIFFGPYDDVHDPDTYLPLISESQYCAPCHQFSFWGTPIYESFDEWLASPYADEGVTCQDCHMPPTGDTYFALPEVGGLERPPESIPSHLDLGASSVALLQNTVELAVSAEARLGLILVTVTITNTEAGHHVPTDFPGRHMILTVAARDQQGRALAQRSGPVVPAWGGAQAGLPGTAYAKVLRDVRSGESPVVSYWKQALIVSDNRIPARQADSSAYVFEAPTGEVEVVAELRFRRAFQALMEAKGWDAPDIMMESARVTVAAAPWWRGHLPRLSRPGG